MTLYMSIHQNLGNLLAIEFIAGKEKVELSWVTQSRNNQCDV